MMIQMKNQEIEGLVTEPNVYGETKAARLLWLGHVVRMGDDRKIEEIEEMLYYNHNHTNTHKYTHTYTKV